MFILDTNVISELRKLRCGRVHPRLASWAETSSTANFYLSAMTLQELEFGVLRAEQKDRAKGMALRTWLNEKVLPEFAERILPVNAAVAICNARIQVVRTRPIVDGLIAATAVVYGMVVVTRNSNDFTATGARVFNPWHESYPTC